MRAALDDTDFVVQPLDEAERHLVLGLAVGRDPLPMAIDHLGEAVEGLEPLPFERRPPVVEEALWHRAPGRRVSENGRLCRGDGNQGRGNRGRRAVHVAFYEAAGRVKSPSCFSVWGLWRSVFGRDSSALRSREVLSVFYSRS